MAGYTKLFESLLDSTVWQEPGPTRLTWITMIAMADQHGIVAASIPGLAKRAGVTLEECEAALATFLAPDRYSRTPDFEGRRIEPAPGGWVLLNHAKYRAMREADDRREYMRTYMAEKRAEKKVLTPVSKVSRGKPPLAQAEADTEAKDQKLLSGVAARESAEQAFERFWAAYPNKKGKVDALKAWKRLKLTPLVDKIIADVELRKLKDPEWLKDNGDFIPHGSTWVNGQRWEDGLAVEPPAAAPTGRSHHGPSPRKSKAEERDTAREAKELLRKNDPDLFRQLYQEEP